MFIRWKHGKRWHTAYLVKSVRVDGKPRHETIAPLVSMQWNTEGDLIGWAKLEMKVQELTLSEQERAQIYRLFAQKVPRPPDEMLEKEKRKITALLAEIDQYKTPVVPDTPPMRVENATTDGGGKLAIRWAGKIARYTRVEYTASLVKRDGEQEEVIELGTIAQGWLDGKSPYGLRDFWFSVHCALCLANVGYTTYEKTLQLLETWVPPLPLDEFIKEVKWRRYYASSQVEKEKRVIHRKLVKLDERDRELYDVYKRGEPFLAEMQRSVSNAQKIAQLATTEKE